MDSKSFLSQNTGIGICYDANISELGGKLDVLKLTIFFHVNVKLLVTLNV